MVIKVGMLVVFFCVMIGVGLYCRKNATDVNGFVLGGRKVGPWLTAFAYGTSYFSAVIFIGYAGQFGWKFGVSSTWIGIGNAIIGSLFAWLLLGRRTRLMTQHLKSRTMPDFFGNRFDSKGLKIAASLIVFIFLIPYTASLYNGLSRLFGMAFHLDYTVCIIMMAVLTGIYVIAGGYMATAINDFIQGIIMLIGIVSVIVAVLNSHGGLGEAVSKMAQVTDASANATNGEFASLFGPDPLSLVFVVILTSLGTWGLPQMVQKFYAIKDTEAIKKGTIISTIFALIVAGGCYFLGGFGRLYDINVAEVGYDAIVPTMLENLSPILVAVVVVLVLSASMSTLSSLVLTSSSTLTLDMIKDNVIKDMDEKKQVFVMRLFIVVFVAISAVIAVVQYKSKVTFIAQLMGISWGALAGAFLAPFVYSLYCKGVTKAAVVVNFIFGTLLMTTNLLDNMFFHKIFPKLMSSPINCGTVAMLGGLVLVPVVSLLTKKLPEQKVSAVFECYDKKEEAQEKKAKAV